MNEISARKLKEKIDSGEKIIIVDVRSQIEYITEHIEKSILIPLNQLSSIEEENIPKDVELYVICRSGSRSAFAVTMLHKMGYEKAINVYDGMIGWNILLNNS